MLSAVAPIDDLSVHMSGTTNVYAFHHHPGEPQLSHPSTHAELKFVSEVYSGLLRHPLIPAKSSLEM